jgi:hypothetical protein
VLFVLWCGGPAFAETLVSPGHPLDLAHGGPAEGAQGPVLVAGDAQGVVAVYLDDRDGRLHAALIDGLEEGGSRASLVLPAEASLVDADLAGGGGGFLLVWAESGLVWGQRLGLAGGLLTLEGAPFAVVGAGAGPASHPRAALGPPGCRWLVALRMTEASASSGPLRTACIDSAGAVSLIGFDVVPLAGDFELTDPVDGSRPALVYVANNGLDGVRVGLIASNGALALSPAPQPISETQVAPGTPPADAPSGSPPAAGCGDGVSAARSRPSTPGTSR